MRRIGGGSAAYSDFHLKLSLQFLVAICTTSSIFAQREWNKLIAFDGSQADSFGFPACLDLDAGIVITSSRFWDGPQGANQGTTYVYSISGRNVFLDSTLVAPDAMALALFGSSIALDYPNLFVSAPTQDNSGLQAVGKVYVYSNLDGIWTVSQELLPSDPTANQFFGGLALESRTLMISSPGDSTLGTSAGAVYVFENESGAWIEKQKLTASDGMPNDYFGIPALGHDLMLVGVSNDSDLGVLAGSAYVFEFNGTTWSETAQLYASDADPNDRFGSSVAISDRTLFVGAFADDELASDAGAVYVYEELNGVWTEVQKLFASDGNAFENFGTGLSTDDGFLVVGAEDADGAVAGTGAAYVFQDTDEGWVEVGKLKPAEGAFNDDIGEATAIDGDVVALHAPGDDTVDTDAGALYLFSLSGAYCPILTGTPAGISLSQGGLQLLRLNAGAVAGDACYWLVGSLSGTCPGFPVFGLQMPINPDDYFALTLFENPASPLTGNMGRLDPSGRGAARLTVAPNSDPGLIGTTIQHAFVAYRLGPLQILDVSNPVPLRLVP